MKLLDIIREQHEELPSVEGIQQLIPQMLKGVQQLYDAWKSEEDPMDDPYAGGGICHEFADIISGVLNENGYEATTISASVGENHVWAVVKVREGVYEVDIPFCIYEKGGGYTWEKIPDVTFQKDDIHIGRLSPDPDDFDQYLEDY